MSRHCYGHNSRILHLFCKGKHAKNITAMKPTCPERFVSPLSEPVVREIPRSAPAVPPQVARHAPAEFDLPHGNLWATSPRAALTIRCVVGQVWVTQAGHAEDIVLLAGDAHTLAPRGRAVIQALVDARVGVGA